MSGLKGVVLGCLQDFHDIVNIDAALVRGFQYQAVFVLGPLVGVTNLDCNGLQLFPCLLTGGFRHPFHMGKAVVVYIYDLTDDGSHILFGVLVKIGFTEYTAALKTKFFLDCFRHGPLKIFFLFYASCSGLILLGSSQGSGVCHHGQIRIETGFDIFFQERKVFFLQIASKLPAGIRLGDNCLFSFLYAENAV